MSKDKINLMYKIGFFVILGVVLGSLIKSYIFCTSYVLGDSMIPTYYDGDMVGIFKLPTPERGDIVIIEHEDKLLIKRCIGMPGDTIQIKGGVVYINDEEYSEDYINNNNYEYSSGIASEPITLGKGEYFVLGDNRLVSKDSRHIGVIRKEQILGVVIWSI